MTTLQSLSAVTSNRENNLPRYRVAFYMRLLYGGGAERVVVNLMAGMVAQGIAVDLVVNTASGPFMGQVPDAVNVIDLAAPRMLEGLPKLSTYLRKSQPDALITGLHYNSEIALWARAWASIRGQCKTKILVVEHNTISVHSQQRKTDQWAPLLSRLFYPWADHIVAVSQGVATDLAHAAKLSQTKIEVIYNPVITPRLTEQATEQLDHPWFQPGEPPVILGIGRLERQKDFVTLIKAFAEAREHLDARLVLLGAGQQQQALELLVNQLGIEDNVQFLGFVSNPYRYLARSSLFVLSSAWEGLSNVLIEAIALDVPVISTDCPHGPREVLSEGKYGSLVPVGDWKRMAQEIVERLLSEGPISKASSSYLEQFSQDSVVQRYLELLVKESA